MTLTRRRPSVLPFGVLLTLLAVVASSARGDVIYGSATVNNNSLWQIDTTTRVATQLTGNLSVTPNSLATNSAARQIYYGDNNGTTLWLYDLTTGTSTQMYNMASLLGGLNGPTMADGGSFYNGNYYLLVQRQLSGGDVGAGNTLYRVNMSSDGLSVLSVDQFNIDSPANRSLGDLGDFAINAQGVAYGSSWDPPGNDRQMGGYWTFDVDNLGSSFDLVQNTRGQGNNAPTYQLAFDSTRSVLYGVDYFTPKRLDVLTYNNNSVSIASTGNITGFTGSQFVDLSSAIATPEPASLLLCGVAGLLAGVTYRRKKWPE